MAGTEQQSVTKTIEARANCSFLPEGIHQHRQVRVGLLRCLVELGRLLFFHTLPRNAAQSFCERHCYLQTRVALFEFCTFCQSVRKKSLISFFFQETYLKQLKVCPPWQLGVKKLLGLRAQKVYGLLLDESQSFCKLKGQFEISTTGQIKVYIFFNLSVVFLFLRQKMPKIKSTHFPYPRHYPSFLECQKFEYFVEYSTL